MSTWFRLKRGTVVKKPTVNGLCLSLYVYLARYLYRDIAWRSLAVRRLPHFVPFDRDFAAPLVLTRPCSAGILPADFTSHSEASNSLARFCRSRPRLSGLEYPPP